MSAPASSIAHSSPITDRGAGADTGVASGRSALPGPAAVASPPATGLRTRAVRLLHGGGRPQEVVRFLKFALVGVANTTVTFLVFNACTAWLELPAAAANVAGWAAGFVNSFVWNRSWTFADRRDTPARRVFLRFAAVNLVTLGVSEGIVIGLEALANASGVTAALGRGLTLNGIVAVAIIGALIVNYALSSRWAFRKS